MASGVVTGDASVGTDTLRSIEFVRGSQFADIYVATGFSGSSANAGSNGTFNEFEGVGGNDTITGNGNTRIAFYNATAGVTVDLAAGTATGDASVGNDTFTGVNNVARLAVRRHPVRQQQRRRAPASSSRAAPATTSSTAAAASTGRLQQRSRR